MKKTNRIFSQTMLAAIVLALFLTNGCLPGAPETKGGRVITVYGFSIMKEALEKEVYPAFAAKWKAEKGEDVTFNSSFAGSEVVTNQILQGTPADLAVLSIERDVDRLVEGKAVTADWRALPNKGIVNKTPSSFSSARATRKTSGIFPISRSRESN